MCPAADVAQLGLLGPDNLRGETRSRLGDTQLAWGPLIKLRRRCIRVFQDKKLSRHLHLAR